MQEDLHQLKQKGAVWGCHTVTLLPKPPFPSWGVLTEPFPLAALLAPQETVTYHPKDHSPRLEGLAHLPTALSQAPVATAKPEGMVLGLSDGVDLPLSLLCVRLWKLTQLPSPILLSQSGLVRGRPTACCLLLCKL